MRKTILAILYFIVINHCYSQNKNESYYLRKSEQYTTIGKLHSYQIMHFSDSNVEFIYIGIQGKIGNLLKTAFFIDTCYKYPGKMNGLDSGYLSINDERKRPFHIRKRSYRILKADLFEKGYVLKFNRMSDWVNFLIQLENYCFCRPLPAAASR
jgi:hypothetical protein